MMKIRFSATLFKILLLFALGGGFLQLSAKEPTNWIFGVGFGAGKSQIDEIYTISANALLGQDGYNTRFGRLNNASVKGFGFVWEFLAGYKHWLNDWVGFRYYANVSGQHYKDNIFTAGKVKADLFEYTANADLLLNFYNSESFTFGIFGGFGVGGAYFDSPAFDNYKATWSNVNTNTWRGTPIKLNGMGEVYKHHLSATLSTGFRFNIFQRFRNVRARVCGEYIKGKRICRVPVAYFEHSIEFNTKFSLMTYKVTDDPEVYNLYIINGNSTILSPQRKPGYEVKNPYKLTLRYVFAF